MKNFDNFGVMIDCSRNAVPSVERLKLFFSVIAKMGYNVAMLYTEDTFEVENEPYFGYKRGRYSGDGFSLNCAFLVAVPVTVMLPSPLSVKFTPSSEVTFP